MLGSFTALGVDSLDDFETKGIAMIQKTRCPDSWKALVGIQEIGAAWAGEAWRNYSICYTTTPAPRSRQTADASTGGQHGLQA